MAVTALATLDPRQATAEVILDGLAAWSARLDEITGLDDLNALDAWSVAVDKRLHQLGAKTREVQVFRVRIYRQRGEVLGPAVQTGNNRRGINQYTAEVESECSDSTSMMSRQARNMNYESRLIAHYWPIVEPQLERVKRPTIGAMLKVIREAPPDTNGAAPSLAVDDERLTLIEGDILDAAAAIANDSIDLILTDPPYGLDALPLYDKLGQLSARVLKPGASLLCMTGQYTLPDVLAILADHLAYHWTIAYLTPGGQSPQIWPRRVNTFWKPVLWFVKSPADAPDTWHGDVIRSNVNDNDKRFHHWGQSESGFARLVEGFSSPGDVILDPFVGGGTTAVAAVPLGRRFVGIDVAASALMTTRQRVAEVMADGR